MTAVCRAGAAAASEVGKSSRSVAGGRVRHRGTENSRGAAVKKRSEAMSDRIQVLSLSCDDKPGIVAAVTTELSSLGANIAEFEPVLGPADQPLLHADRLSDAGWVRPRSRGTGDRAGGRALRDADDAGRPGAAAEDDRAWSRSSTTRCCICSTRSGSAGSTPRWWRSSRTTRRAGEPPTMKASPTTSGR